MGTEPHRRRYPRRIAVTSLVIVLVAVAIVVVATGYARFRFDQVKKVHLPHLRQIALPNSENILIVGSNTRTGLAPGDAQKFGSPQQIGGARSDVTMVLHLDPANGTASLLSIPRDLFVQLPPHSMSGPVGKIDAALNDGPDNLVAAVTGDLGIPIDHYVELNFDQFQNVINALGGIRMNFPMPLRDALSGLNITHTGCQRLGGFQALAVVRARHLEYYANGKWNYDPLSDLSRIRRDQTFLRILVSTIEARGLNNPVRAQAVLGSLVHDITIDSGLSESELLSLGTRFRHINPATTPELTLPITTVLSYHFGGGNYGDVDFASQPQDQQVIARFLGTPVPSPTPGPSVDIQDISGVPGHAQVIARQLSALGFTISSATQSYAPALPTESVVRYPPGALSQAEDVLSALRGAVVLYPDAAVPAGHVLVQSGSVLAVAPPASPASPTAPGVQASPTAPVSHATPSPTASPAIPTPGGQQPSPSIFAPQPYDPTACAPARK